MEVNAANIATQQRVIRVQRLLQYTCDMMRYVHKLLYRCTMCRYAYCTTVCSCPLEGMEECIVCEGHVLRFPHNSNRHENDMTSLRDQFALSWTHYFYDDKYSSQDPRVEILEVFFNFFNNSEDALQLVFPFNTWECCYIDVLKLTAALPISDFDDVLVSRPVEMSKCLGIALSTVYRVRNPYSETIVVYPHFYNTRSITAFVNVKASTVGQLICVEGQVTRVNPSRVMLSTGRFKCAKCRQVTAQCFEDGIYEPPKVCSTIK
ncbi:hypothetical protein EON65_39405 [archaeon]|nr:MAG: hypothetical protein EON65_39405 [archaeon]